MVDATILKDPLKVGNTCTTIHTIFLKGGPRPEVAWLFNVMGGECLVKSTPDNALERMRVKEEVPRATTTNGVALPDKT